MKVHYDEGVATRIGPEPCVGVREGVGEASAGERAGQPLSHERIDVPGADGVHPPEGEMVQNLSQRGEGRRAHAAGGRGLQRVAARALDRRQAQRGRFKIRVKNGHKVGGRPARTRLVISPTTLRLALPAILVFNRCFCLPKALPCLRFSIGARHRKGVLTIGDPRRSHSGKPAARICSVSSWVRCSLRGEHYDTGSGVSVIREFWIPRRYAKS